MFALSYSSVCKISLTSSGGIDAFVSGRIKDVRVDHQSIDGSVSEESLSANFSKFDLFAFCMLVYVL